MTPGSASLLRVRGIEDIPLNVATEAQVRDSSTQAGVRLPCWFYSSYKCTR